MRHGGGVVSAFLYMVAALHGCRASCACPPTVAAVGTSRDRSSAREMTGRTSTVKHKEVVVEGSRDRTVDCEETGRTSSVQCKSVVKSVPVWQRDDATCGAEFN